MTVQLTQKERLLLEDQKSHEEMCVEKYTNYAQQAQDEQLKQIFTSYAQQEQQHLDSVNQMLSGKIPSTQNQEKEQPAPQNKELQPTGTSGTEKDAKLCNDMLMTEKYVSGTYDTAVFEFQDTNMRNALNHIQKEEQQHGEGIFNYMVQNGMYQPK